MTIEKLKGGRRRYWPAAIVLICLVLAVGWLLIGRGDKPGPGRGADTEGPNSPIKVVFWDYNWPMRPGVKGTYREWLEARLASFKEANPEIEVEYRLLSWGTGPAELAEAWAPGNESGASGPDLYSGPLESLPNGLEGLSPFETGMIPENPMPWAAAPIIGSGRVKALPRWGMLEALGGDPSALKSAGLNPDAVVKEGWTYAEFGSALQKIGRTRRLGRKVWGLTVDQDGRFLHGLAAVAGAPRIFTPSGRTAWTAESLYPAVELVSPLISDGTIALASSGRDSMLELYLSQRTGLVGPVGPWLISAMEDRRKRGLTDFRETVLLPFPASTREDSRALMSLSVLAVRSEPGGRGGRRAEAARLLARHLAAASGEVSSRLGAVGAYRNRHGVNSAASHLELLAERAKVIPAQPGAPGGPGILIYHGNLAEAAGLLLKGKMDPQAFLGLIANLVSPPK